MKWIPFLLVAVAAVAQFDDAKPAAEAVQKTCFPCHENVRVRDFVFNRYAP